MKLIVSAVLATTGALRVSAGETHVQVVDRESTRSVYVYAENVMLTDPSFTIQASTEVNVSTVYVINSNSQAPFSVIQQGAPFAVNQARLVQTAFGYTAMTFDPPLPLRAGDILGFGFNTQGQQVNVQYVLYGNLPVPDGTSFH